MELWIYVIPFCLAVLVSGCTHPHGKPIEVNTMTVRSAEAFANIEHGDGTPNTCTPQISDDFVGVKINIPDKVTWSGEDKDPFSGAFSRVMLCGIYRLAAACIVGTEGFYLSASLVATNTRTHKVYYAKIRPDHPGLENPDLPQFSAKELEGVYETGYFNVNIVEVLDLPEEAAEYLVFVVFKSFKSNVASIVLEPKI